MKIEDFVRLQQDKINAAFIEKLNTICDDFVLTQDHMVKSVQEAGGRIVYIPMVEVVTVTLGKDDEITVLGTKLVSLDEGYEMLKSKIK